MTDETAEAVSPSSRSDFVSAVVPTATETKASEGVEGSGSQTAGLAFDTDKNRAAEEEGQAPIECRQVPAQIVEGGIARGDKTFGIGHLERHNGLAAVRSDERTREIHGIGGTIKTS